MADRCANFRGSRFDSTRKQLSKNVGAGRVLGIIFTVILCAVLTVETGYSVMLQMDNIHIDNGESFVEYETAMEGL
mgnify:CR=1 FL=1